MSFHTAAAVLAVLLTLSANVRASTVVTTLKMSTHRTGASCIGLAESAIDAANNCNGGFEKSFTTANNGKHNIMPQQDEAFYTVLTYEGSLPAGQFISLVDTDRSLTSDPCTAVEASHDQDELHSGVMKGTVDGAAASADGKVLLLNQTEVLLAATKDFAVCYATGNGSSSDSSWAYADITVRISRLSRIDVYDKQFRSCGIDRPCVIPNHPSLTLRYYGTIDTDRWISFVDSTLNSDVPCASGQVAAGWPDDAHTGSRAATGRVFTVNTASLSASKIFTVCYSENGGIQGSQWVDSGLRFQRSALTSVEYGVETARVGSGVSYSSWNRNHDDNDIVATDRLPATSRTTVISYSGELGDSAYISLVDATLGNGQPCFYPQIAAASQDASHSAAAQATSRLVSLANLASLHANNTDTTVRVYAVCYAITDGSATDLTWSDSYVRYSLSRLESVQHHTAIHATSGQIPYQADLELVFEGDTSMLQGFVLMKEQDASYLIPNVKGISTYAPCSHADAGTASNSANYQAGGTPAADAGGSMRVVFDTTGLDTGAIVNIAGDDTFARGDPLITNANNREYTGSSVNTLRARGRFIHSFAVCYKQYGSTSYYDSGIRLTVSKMSKIQHGKSDTPYVPYDFFPGAASYVLPATGQARARQVIPTTPGQTVTYAASPTAGTALGDRLFSLVDSTMNSGKPCLGAVPWSRTVDAAVAADTLHSGSLQAASSVVTIPQAVPFDDTKTFAVCYSITSGTSMDETWHDSYIRLTVSAVESITSLGVAHKVNNYVATIASRTSTTDYNVFYYKQTTDSLLPLTYAGTLAASKYISFVDQTLNANFPCASDGVASGQTGASGGLAPVAGGASGADNTSTVLFATDALNVTVTYAVCYGTGASTGFHDSGIRVTRSIVTSVQAHSGYSKPIPREMTSVLFDTNRIPAQNAAQWAANTKLSYVGAIAPDGSNLWLSLVRSSLNGGDPCVKPAISGAAAGTENSGSLVVAAVAADLYYYIAPVTNAHNLLAETEFAVCYATTDGTNTDSTYRDSYIRVTTSRIAALDHNVGRFTDLTNTPGRVVRHRTDGHLPSTAPADKSLWYSLAGNFDASETYRISLVAVDGAGASAVEDGMTYRRPCGSSADRPASTHNTDPILSTSQTTSKAFFGSFDTVTLATDKVFALCYRAGSVATWYDSGLRFTVSKIQKLVYHTTESPLRENSPVFLSTNRLAQHPTRQLQFVGESNLQAKYISLVPDNTVTGILNGGATESADNVGSTGTLVGDGNPCVEWATAAANASAAGSGVIQLTKSRTCTTLDDYRRTITGGDEHTARVLIDGSWYNNVASGDVVADWGACRDACEADPLCLSVVYNKRSRQCFPSSSDSGTEDDSDYATMQYGEGQWSSATCETGTVDDTAMIPQINKADMSGLFLAAGADFATTYAVCYSEFNVDTTTLSTGTASDIWKDSYLRFRITPLGGLETSGTVHWTTGHVPIVGEATAYDYWDTTPDFHFVYKGQDAATTNIKLISAELNDNYPCIASLWASTTPATDSTPDAGTRDNSGLHHLMITTGLNTNKTFAVCLKQSTNYGDSGIRVTVSKVGAVTWASQQGQDAGQVHDATDARVMTSKPALTNRFPRHANQILTVVPSVHGGVTSQGMPSNVYISLVRTTLNMGKPCVGPDAYGTASASRTGPVLASALAATIPQSTLLGAGNVDWKFRVCYGSTAGSDGDWKDSYITLEMTDITSFNVHISSNTGLRALTGDSAEKTLNIYTLGQIPSEFPGQTTRYSITSGDGSFTTPKISLVESMDNFVIDSTVNGTNSNPTLNSGYNRPDPCRALLHADTAPDTWSAWKAARGTAIATHGTVAAGSMQDLDTTLVNSTNLFAVCYSLTGTKFHDSGIRITVSQVTALHYFDLQGRLDRTREITSVTKPYNVLPLTVATSLTYVGFYSEKWISFVDASLNNGNPCVRATLADGNKVQADPSKVISTISRTADTVYAVCYATQPGQQELAAGAPSRWVQSSPNLGSTWRDTYLRILSQDFVKLTTYGIDMNNRGQLPSNPTLGIAFTGITGGQISLVKETLNSMTINAVSYAFPCTTEFGSNADGPLKALGSCKTTNDCTHSGVTNLTGSSVFLDTTDIDTQIVLAVCYNPTPSDPSKWRDLGVRVTMPEIQSAELDSGHVGTPPRMFKSWDSAADGVTIYDRPTSRLPAYANQVLKYVKHPSTPTARSGNGAEFVIAEVSSHAKNNPCAGAGATPVGLLVSTSSVCGTPNQCIQSDVMVGASSLITVPQGAGELLKRNTQDPTNGMFTICYRSITSSDGTIQALMHQHPNSHVPGSDYLNNTVHWEDTYIRFSISGVQAITASGVTHVTTGQIPITAAESVTTWGTISGGQPAYPFKFTYVSDNTSFINSGYLTLVDETLNPGSGYNTESSPYSNAEVDFAVDPTVAASSGVITTWDTTGLNSSKVYAVCYSLNNGANSYSDSGIRVTVPAVHAILYSSGHAGLGHKEDTRSRPMTAATLPTNTFPRAPSADFTYVGTLPNGQFVSLVKVAVSATSNPCVVPANHGPSAAGNDNATHTAPNQAGATTKLVTILQPTNELLASGNFLYAVCYDGGHEAPLFRHSPECDCGAETNPAAYATCQTTCAAAVGINLGSASSITWRDSYIRLRITDVNALTVHTGMSTRTAARHTITIKTAGGIPATLGNSKQVAFEYVGSMPAVNDNSNQNVLRLIHDEKNPTLDSLTGLTHPNPCGVADSVTADHTASAVKEAAFGSKKILDLQTDSLNTTMRFALCYSLDGSGGTWMDSGIRVTVSKIQSLHFMGDVPYNAGMLANELKLLELRQRTFTSSKTVLNRLPRIPGVKLRWDGFNSGWAERAASHSSEFLSDGKFLSIVALTTSPTGNPCADPAKAAAAASSLGASDARTASGVMGGTQWDGTGSGMWVTVNQSAGNLLAPSSGASGALLEFAVCYASGDGTATDITWRDSFIRFETSDVTSITQTVASESGAFPDFLHSHKTTGQLADSPTLQITYSGPIAAPAQILLVDENTLAQEEESGLDNFTNPCGGISTGSPAVNNYSTGAINWSSGTASVDTTRLHREISGVEVIYAVCYKQVGATNRWEDSALRVSLTQIQQILTRSGYDRGEAFNTLAIGDSATSIDDGGSHALANHLYYDEAFGIDTKLDTMARHMTSSYNEKNRLSFTLTSTPIHARIIQYVTVPYSLMSDTLGNNKKVSFVAESQATSWSSPCDQVLIAAAATGTADYSGEMTAGASSKNVGFNSSLLTNDERYALCYSHGPLGSWRDSYIRFKFSKIQSIKTVDVETWTHGQIPSVPATDELEFKYTGTLDAHKFISLVDQTMNNYVPCSPAFAISGSGVHQSHLHQQTVTTLNTENLLNMKEYAVCYAEIDGTAGDNTWADSGIRATVSMVKAVTLPFDWTKDDSCRGAGTCSTSDRIMTAFPAPTNRLPRLDGTKLTYQHSSGNVQANLWISIVDAALNNFNPCVDPSIPGTADQTLNFAAAGSTANNQRQITLKSQASSSLVTIPQGTNDLLFGASEAVNAASYNAANLGKRYAICYSTGTGADDDVLWRDSYIRLIPSELVNFGTKNVPTFTYGVIPHHYSGLEYFYGMDSNSVMAGAANSKRFLTLVETVIAWSPPQVATLAKVLAGDLTKVEFVAAVSPYGTLATTMVVGWKIKIGADIRTVVYVDAAQENAWVSIPFSAPTSGSGASYLTQEYTNPDYGFATKAYDPCSITTGSNSVWSGAATSDPHFIARAEPAGSLEAAGLDEGGIHYRSLNGFDTTNMKPKVSYAVCYSANVLDGDTTTDDWFDSGLRVEVSQLSAIEYSGHKRGVKGVPTAYNLGYEEVGLGDCTGTSIESYYYYDARKTDADCLAACNLYSDCLGYQASTVPVPEYGGRTKHCKIWKGTSMPTSVISGASGAWGNSICKKKTSGDDEITRGKTHRKIQSVLPPLQPAQELVSNVLPVAAVYDLVYAGTLPASKYIAIVAANPAGSETISVKSASYNPCTNPALPATGSSTSSGPVRACQSIGAGYTVQREGGQYALPGGLCKPSGEVCADRIGSIMAKLVQTGCPNTNPKFVPRSVMHPQETADWSTVASNLKSVCDAAMGGSGTPDQMSACCGQNADGSPIQCTVACSLPSSDKPDCKHEVSTQFNKEVNFNMGTLLDSTKQYTVCYTDGDGSATDTNWKDSYIRVSLSKITAIKATGVTHKDHGHLASHDNEVKLEVEYIGVQTATNWQLSFLREDLANNNPCGVTAFADGTDGSLVGDEFSVSDAGDSNKKVRIKTSHLNTNYSYAVCYGVGGGVWHDSGIRVRISELTNVRYNEAQVGGPLLGSTGQYTRDMTSSRVRIAPRAASTFFADQAAGYAALAPYEDIRDTVATHTLPHNVSVDLSYLGTLPSVRGVAFVEITSNFGDPCVLGSVVSGTASAARTSTVTADGSNGWTVTAADMALLDHTKTYTLCYDALDTFSSTSNPDAQNHEGAGQVPISAGGWASCPDATVGCGAWRQGLGVPVAGWRDSYIRFKISLIQNVGSHMMEHVTQGQLALSSDYEVTVTGSLISSTGGNGKIALVDETLNTYVPCITAHAMGSASDARSGAILAPQAKVAVDTGGLDTTKNFAVCYKDLNNWYDSGIRVWVSKVSMLRYNREQPTEVAEEVYMRTMTSTNLATFGAADLYPMATNRLPIVGSSGAPFNLRYYLATTSGLSSAVPFSFVDASIIQADGPCASLAVASAASDNTHLTADSVGFDINVSTTDSSFLSGVALSQQIAVCYFDNTTQWGGQWRDSHIRLQRSEIAAIESYGIVHKTYGMISRKANLRVGSHGPSPSPNPRLMLTDSTQQSNRPCQVTVGSLAASLSSGPSINNDETPNSHELDTSALDVNLEYALCWEDSSVWYDTGIRLKLPKVTTISYSRPTRTITSSSCFTSNLWGLADCNPSKNCSGAFCSGGDPSALCAADATASCSVIPRDNGADGQGIDYSIWSPESATAAGVTFVSFVEHSRGVQSNNPCRDATEAAAPATTVATDNQREHSGPLPVTNGAFKLPQLSDQGTFTNYLKEDGTFAVCYATGAGDASDSTWRDSYIRITLSKIAHIQGSDMVITTRGMLANVPSLRVSWSGSLGFKKWINLIEVTDNSNIPCNKANAESLGEQCAESCSFDLSNKLQTETDEVSTATCKIKCEATATCAAYTFLSDTGKCYLFTATLAYTGTQTRGTATASSGMLDGGLFKQSGWLQAASAEDFVNFDTTSLTADVLYTVCYADEAAPSTGAPGAGAPWTDSGIRLRFVRWTNPEKNRLVSGAATHMKFTINHGTSSPGLDYFALIKGATDCTGASAAPLLSDGNSVKKAVQSGINSSHTMVFAMPSGTGASYRATGWRTCRPVLLGPERLDMNNEEACDEPGLYQDLNMNQGSYIMCFCDSDNGNSGCDHTNEWIKLSSSGVTPAMLSVIQTPRIGRAYENFGVASHIGSVRAISTKSHTYNIKTTTTAGLEIREQDKIFFKAADCSSIPSADAANETGLIDVTSYDTNTASATYKSARVVTPSVTPLTSLGANPRSLVSCFATQEVVNAPGGPEARDFVKLQDGLEVVPKPRLGSNIQGGANGVIRSLSGSSPLFDVMSLRKGDKLFFKEQTTFTYQLTGFLTQKAGATEVCDYTNGEYCSCSNLGVLACSNAAHECAGFSCTNTIPEGADTDCTDGAIQVNGDITNVLLAANQANGTALLEGTTFYDQGVGGQTVTKTVTITNFGKYALDGISQAEVDGSVGNTYIFNMDSATLDNDPMVFSASEGGVHNDADTWTTDMTFYLDGVSRPLDHWLRYFKDATTRSITYTPTASVMLYYFSYSNTAQNQYIQTYMTPQALHLYENTRTPIGAFMMVNKDDAGTFQLPTDVPLTSISETVPRFLSACFIPAGAVESLHAPLALGGANCSYHAPHDSTCTKSLVNAHRLEDYLQVLPEPTANLKETHNHTEVFDLKFNEPSFGTFWRSTNHWCSDANTFLHPCGARQSDRGFGGSSSLCCQAPPNFAAGSPGDVVVFKKETAAGTGDCNGVEAITDADYFIGAQYTRKMVLTTIDSDRTSQTDNARSDLSQGALRSVSAKGAEASHLTIAQSKVNELPEGFYTICYATAESGADDNADFVKLTKSLEIVPKTVTGPLLQTPRTVLLGHNINVIWGASSGLHVMQSETFSWIGLFKTGECPNGSGEFQNKCYLASQTVDAGIAGTGTVTFAASDYKLEAGSYEVRYFDGTSRDKQGVVCRGMPNVEKSTYTYCVLESVLTSSPIVVYTGRNNLEDATATPGLEFVFNGQKARYAGSGGGLPGYNNVEHN